jgi:hypothetical protein
MLKRMPGAVRMVDPHRKTWRARMRLLNEIEAVFPSRQRRRISSRFFAHLIDGVWSDRRLDKQREACPNSRVDKLALIAKRRPYQRPPALAVASRLVF